MISGLSMSPVHPSCKSRHIQCDSIHNSKHIRKKVIIFVLLTCRVLDLQSFSMTKQINGVTPEEGFGYMLPGLCFFTLLTGTKSASRGPDCLICRKKITDVHQKKKNNPWLCCSSQWILKSEVMIKLKQDRKMCRKTLLTLFKISKLFKTFDSGFFICRHNQLLYSGQFGC